MSDYDKLSDDVIDLMIRKRGQVERYSHEIYAMARELRERRDAEHTIEAHDGAQCVRVEAVPPMDLPIEQKDESSITRKQRLSYAEFVNEMQRKFGVCSGVQQQITRDLLTYGVGMSKVRSDFADGLALMMQPISDSMYSEEMSKALREDLLAAKPFKVVLHKTPAPLTAVSEPNYPKLDPKHVVTVKIEEPDLTHDEQCPCVGGDGDTPCCAEHTAVDPNACRCIPQTKGCCSMCGGWGPT